MAEGESAHPPKPRGKPTLAVPRFGEKLSYLLSKKGKNQAWLSSALTGRAGGPSQASITGWKTRGAIPTEYVADLCKLFFISETVLADPDLNRFRASIDREPASLLWRRIVDAADEGPEGLQLIVEGGMPRPLGNLLFAYESVPAPSAPPIVLQAGRQQLRLGLPTKVLEGVAAGGAAPFDMADVAVFCRDPGGWRTLCPNRHDAGFVRDGQAWLLPGPRYKPLTVDGPPGRFCLVAVVVAKAFPRNLKEELLRDPGARGAVPDADDSPAALAAWIRVENAPYLAFKREFFVSVPPGGLRR